MSRAVIDYDAGWHPQQKRGVIRMHFDDGAQGGWDGQDAAEFAALLQVLQHPNAHVTKTGWLATGPHEPGSPDGMKHGAGP